MLCKHQSSRPIINHTEEIGNPKDLRFIGHKSLKSRGDLIFCVTNQALLIWLIQNRSASIAKRIEFPRCEKVYNFRIEKVALVSDAKKIDICLQLESEFLVDEHEHEDEEREPARVPVNYDDDDD